jgi:hypothetical protein
MTRSRLTALALLLAAALGGGCTGQTSTAPAPPNAITIVTLTPAAGTRLAPGAAVTFSATLAYMLNNAGSAEVSMVIEDQGNVVLNSGNQPTTVVSATQGTATLTGALTVPAAGVTQLQVLFTLTPNTSVPIPVVAAANYPVGR